MKQAKTCKREFKDLSAWDVLTGEAEKRKAQIDWLSWATQVAPGMISKSFMVDYLVTVSNTHAYDHEIEFKILKNRNSTNETNKAQKDIN